MMNHRLFLAVGLILTGLLLAACGSTTPAEESEPDRVATRVAEDLAVRQRSSPPHSLSRPSYGRTGFAYGSGLCANPHPDCTHGHG